MVDEICHILLSTHVAFVAIALELFSSRYVGYSSMARFSQRKGREHFILLPTTTSPSKHTCIIEWFAPVRCTNLGFDKQ